MKLRRAALVLMLGLLACGTKSTGTGESPERVRDKAAVREVLASPAYRAVGQAFP